MKGGKAEGVGASRSLKSQAYRLALFSIDLLEILERPPANSYTILRLHLLFVVPFGFVEWAAGRSGGRVMISVERKVAMLAMFIVAMNLLLLYIFRVILNCRYASGLWV